jgi:hypothetical protein
LNPFPWGFHNDKRDAAPRIRSRNVQNQTTLERVPKDKWDWKPHEKSGTLDWMAGHVATLPGFMITLSASPDYDVSKGGLSKVDQDADLVGLFSRISSEARRAVGALSDGQLNETWSLKHTGRLFWPDYAMTCCARCALTT